MKIAPFLIGAISAQSGDDADRWDNTDFSLTDNIFTYEQPKDERFDKTKCAVELVIQAVTCWESNHMGNLDHYVTVNDDNFGWKNIHHGHDQGNHSGQATTGLGQGTQESTNYGKRVPSTSPNYQIGTYSRGMMTDGYTANSKTAVNRIDYHSAMAFDNRYSGCIYEAADWDYNADSYNKIWRMSYGYDPSRTDNITTPTVTKYYNDASGIDKSNTVPIRPNWWHYFNSHILNVGQFDNAFDSYGLHLLVMANPAYEGLGYLNWITTFAKNAPENDDTDCPRAEADLGHWNVFPGSAIRNSGDGTGTAGTINDPAIATDEDNYTEGRFRGMVNYNTHDTVTDLYSGGYAFHLGRNCDTHLQASEITLVSGTIAAGTDLNMNPELDVHTRSSETATAGTIYTAGMNYDSYGIAGTIEAETSQWYSYLINPGSSISDPSLNPQIDTTSQQTLYPWMSMAAVSSFPHNDLGQDFRFNIRILHHGGRGFPYYFLGNEASSKVLTDGGTTPGGVEVGGTPSTTENFSITNSQINYLAQDSYYWYKVNTVQIMFPSYVRCPRFPRNIAIDRDNTFASSSATTGTFAASLAAEEMRSASGELEDTFRCMDSGNFNGHRGWDSSKPYQHNSPDVYSTSAYDGYSATNHRPTENYPYYLETLTENDGSKYAGIAVHRNKAEAADASTNGAADIQFDNEPGFICGDVPPFNPQGGTLTLDDYKGEWYKCGQKYTVHGLMNMYDEHAQLEYGTQQEIWFQFWYHYVITWDIDSSVGNSAVTTPITRASFWDKRNSNTARDDNVANDTSHSDWPTTGVATDSNVFHDGTHDNVYFTMSNYKNSFNSAGTQQIYYDHIHNYPNILFNAFELRGIRFYCDQINSYNSNTCFHTNQPTPGSATGFEIIGDTMSNP